MNFMAMGTINSYTKNMGQSIKLDQKMGNIRKSDSTKKSLNGKGGAQTPFDHDLELLRNQAESNRRASQIGSLEAKVKSGKQLTKEELEYLKKEMPELYDTAKTADAERKAYEEKLKKARTKEDVARIQKEKMEEFHSKAKSTMGSPYLSEGKKREIMNQLQCNLASVCEAHNKFLKSAEYEELPREEDIDKDKDKNREKDESKSLIAGLQSSLKLAAETLSKY